jgi:ubiquitin-conjugating enzyme E2 J1
MPGPGYNSKLPSVKRILQEARELELDPSDQYVAAPLEDNLFEWHFTVRGPDGTAFRGGRYHGRLLMPSEYPFKPPTIMMLTPNGRFETRKRICLSISDFHPEQWQPAWGVRTIMTALIAFFPTASDGAIGGLDYTADERVALSLRSLAWTCDSCGACMRTALREQPAAGAGRAGGAGGAPRPWSLSVVAQLGLGRLVLGALAPLLGATSLERSAVPRAHRC